MHTRTAVFAASVLTFAAVSTVGSSAHAEGARSVDSPRNVAKSTKLIASAEPLPQLPAASAPAVEAPPGMASPLTTSERPAADKAQATTTTTTDSDKGATFFGGAGMRFLAGAVSRQADTVNALEVSLSFRGGYYFTPHFGLLVGVDGGFGELMKGCVTSGRSSSGDEDKCGAASVNVPVLAQYAFDTRRSGAYLEGGVSLFNVQLFTATKQTAVLYSTADLALGAGYHFRDSSGRALELSLHADIGQYSSASLNNDGKSASVDIASENRAFHVATTVGLGWQF